MKSYTSDNIFSSYLSSHATTTEPFLLLLLNPRTTLNEVNLLRLLVCTRRYDFIPTTETADRQ